MLMPRVRHVSSRMRSLNRKIAFGAMRRFGSLPPVKLNPRNFLSLGRATALFTGLTLSLSFVVNRLASLFRASFRPDLAVGALALL